LLLAYHVKRLVLAILAAIFIQGADKVKDTGVPPGQPVTGRIFIVMAGESLYTIK
jgi:hypothetical protein